MPRWKLPQTVEEAKQVKIFSGGACNILGEDGKLKRNEERDMINDWLSEKSLAFFDPQIHPDTHGREYEFELDFPMEAAARQAAAINLYEISPYTFGSATSLEIAINEYQDSMPTVIYFSDGNKQQDRLPPHSKEGYPMFIPKGMYTTEDNMRAHYREAIKTSNLMRKYLIKYAERLQSLTVTFSDTHYEGDIMITPHRVHAEDMFRAIVRAASGKRSIVTFAGGEAARDAKGNPVMTIPNEAPPVQMRAFLDEYLDEGNALRRAMCELVRINVFFRVVYTQQSAIEALKDLMYITHLNRVESR